MRMMMMVVENPQVFHFEWASIDVLICASYNNIYFLCTITVMNESCCGEDKQNGNELWDMWGKLLNVRIME